MKKSESQRMYARPAVFRSLERELLLDPQQLLAFPLHRDGRLLLHILYIGRFLDEQSTTSVRPEPARIAQVQHANQIEDTSSFATARKLHNITVTPFPSLHKAKKKNCATVTLSAHRRPALQLCRKQK